MQRKPVTSSTVVSVGYDHETRTLEVEFKSGTYQYFDVPPERHNALMSSESLGRHFGEHVRGKYRFAKVGSDAPTPAAQTDAA
jgi:hypothetical protein